MLWFSFAKINILKEVTISKSNMNRACFVRNTNLHGQNQHASSLSAGQAGIRPLRNNFFRMKNVIRISGVILLILLIHSCKEESVPADERDKFVGTWTSNLYFGRIGQEFSGIVIISKSKTNLTQIIFTEQGSSSSIRTASITGTSYVFQSFTSTIGITGTYTGGGSINGKVIQETGIITSNGSPFQGDLGEWGRILNKQ